MQQMPFQKHGQSYATSTAIVAGIKRIKIQVQSAPPPHPTPGRKGKPVSV